MMKHGFEIVGGQLRIGDFTVSELAREYQTPLYLMDEARIRSRMRLFKKAFRHKGLKTEVLYASKAFLNLAMVQLVESEGLGLDVVSGGELYTAIQAGFPLERVYFHGNNKSREELAYAIEQRVGTIILDNPTEAALLSELLPDGQIMRVLLRVNPGIDAHTHAYIATTTHDSKFGVSLHDPSTLDLIRILATNPKLDFLGLHCHIGSQILERSSYHKEIEVLFGYLADLKTRTGIAIRTLNLGGGFGVTYTAEDEPIDLERFLPEWLEAIEATCSRLGLKVPELLIEPGRSIVAEAGITVYQVGSIKVTHSAKQYAFVDGSMADAIRTALYQAEYEAVLADRADESGDGTYTIAGKACESGDILIHGVKLPEPRPGDYLAVFSTGAYHYSMSSNYNRLVKPAVVFVNHDKAKVIVKRETYADLVRNDLPL